MSISWNIKEIKFVLFFFFRIDNNKAVQETFVGGFEKIIVFSSNSYLTEGPGA
jgi:hypothetical protein